MKQDVRFTHEAGRCVRDICDWLAARSPAGAARWLDALEAASGRIAERAESFGLAPEADQFSEPLRQTLFKTPSGKTFRALFVIREGLVYIVSVRGAGQALIDPASIVLPP
ncbi:MAG: type II toxin-antitoxin system RelE/ParE family toxin [Pirellulales bacterium]